MTHKYIIIDGQLYYLPIPDSDVPKHFRKQISTQFHDRNDHMSIDKNFDAITAKYYWPNLSRKVYD